MENKSFDPEVVKTDEILCRIEGGNQIGQDCGLVSPEPPTLSNLLITEQKHSEKDLENEISVQDNDSMPLRQSFENLDTENDLQLNSSTAIRDVHVQRSIAAQPFMNWEVVDTQL